MKNKNNKRIQKIFKTPIWLDLLITIIGVILALMLTNVYENYQLKKTQKEAIGQVWDEVRNNQEMLGGLYEQMSAKFEAFRVLDIYTQEDLKVIVPKDSIEWFKLQVAPIFKIHREEKYSDSTLRIGGDVRIFVESRLLSGKLRNSVWNSFSRQPDFLSITNFETIADLEQMHAVQLQVNEQILEWRKLLWSGFNDGIKEREYFLMEWFTLISNQIVLLEMYNYNLSEIDKE